MYIYIYILIIYISLIHDFLAGMHHVIFYEVLAGSHTKPSAEPLVPPERLVRPEGLRLMVVWGFPHGFLGPFYV